ncbi:MAG: ParB/RepB/Spo0J family partition protein [Candidatus Vogelbacteria bacterium]
MSEIYNDSIFWIEVIKIKPNPLQPRREFNEDRLRDLADSIRQYGVLQPLVLTRHENEREDGSLYVEYELIAGERRWRAAQLAGLSQVPCVIRAGGDNDKLKLEMAIIENLQREDLNSVDRALAFERLVKEFKLKHAEIAKKVGKSREYVTNTLRILSLSEEMLNAITIGQMTEGHTRPLLMLIDRPDAQKSLFQEITIKKLNVREAEQIARRIANDRVRKKEYLLDPGTIELERKLAETLGARVSVEHREAGGKVTIDFFTTEDLRHLLDRLMSDELVPVQTISSADLIPVLEPTAEVIPEPDPELDLYNIKNFTV